MKTFKFTVEVEVADETTRQEIAANLAEVLATLAPVTHVPLVNPVETNYQMPNASTEPPTTYPGTRIRR